MQQWALARAVHGEKKRCLDHINVEWITFLTVSSPAVHCYHTLKNTSMCYNPVLKTGSDAILSNILAHYKTGKSKTLWNEAEMSNYRTGLPDSMKGVDGAYEDTFMFVRDPLQHFYSAMAEIQQRTIGYGRSYGYTEEVAASYSIEQYLDSIINAQQSTRKDFADWEKDKMEPMFFQLAHLRLVSNGFFNFNITIVKHLENFKDDWQDLHDKYKLDFDFDFHRGVHGRTAVHHPLLASHNTTDDNLHVHSRLDALFLEKPEYLRAVCRILLIDYVCLPEYKLPEACLDMQDTIIEARKQLIVCDDDDNVQFKYEKC